MVQIVEYSSSSPESRSNSSPEPRSKSSSESARDDNSPLTAGEHRVTTEDFENDVVVGNFNVDAASGDTILNGRPIGNQAKEDVSESMRDSNTLGKKLLDGTDERRLQQYLVYGSRNGWMEKMEEMAVTPRIRTDDVADDKPMFPSSNKNKSNFKKMGRFEKEIFLAAVFEMLCDDDFEGLPGRLREALKQVAKNFIHAPYLSEDYEAFRTAIRRRITETLLTARNINIDNSLTVCTPERRNYFLSSRYDAEFKEVKMIGHGGFGQVFHVHSNIDDCDYAVKKIRFKLETSAQVLKIVNEVRLLAAVQHRNIVRYYGAWAELVHPSSAMTGDTLTEEDDEEALGNFSTDHNQSALSATSAKQTQTDVDPSSPIKRKDLVHAKSGQFREQNSVVLSSKPPTSGPASRSLVVAKRADIKADPLHSLLPHSGTAIMFVQMELCSRTLSDYLVERNAESKPKVDRQFIKNIMEQLMSAVAHLHFKNIIHRDIKPCNIFLREDNSSSIPCVLLGDFGLACLHRTKMAPVSSAEDKEAITHSAGVGTYAYAAPEQQKSAVYDNAVDIYSAGIIFFELCSPFGTAMERAVAIERLKEGKLSKEFEVSFPDEAKLIKQMCMKNPEQRPHAFEIVAKLGKFGGSTDFLKDRIGELEKEVKRLKKLLNDNNIVET